MGREHDTVDNHRRLRVSFVPYGLAAWTGTRRLDLWQYSADSSRAAQIWLGHDDQLASLTVGTFDPLDLSADSLDLAEELTIKLVNIGLPGPQAPRTDGFGCWAGTVDGHSLGVYGTGNPPDTLMLVPFADTTPYGFDVTAGVRFIDMRGPDSWPQPADWHPDHRFLL